MQREPSLRRNGMPASCEPCRRSKVRCDHKVPTCTRCQRRRIADSCFYHPGPLTQRERLTPTHSVQASPTIFGTVETLNTLSNGETHYPSSGCSLSPYLGFLGSTSFAADFVSIGDPAGGFHTNSSVTRADSSNLLHTHWFTNLSKVLMLLMDFSILENLVSEFLDVNPAPVVPAPFTRNSFPSIRKLRDKYLPGEVSKLASKLVENTATSFQIPGSTQGCDFHKLYTGVNFRLEILGTIFSQAGRSTQLGLGSGAFMIRGKSQTRAQFAQKMYLASDVILQVCKILTPTNDLLVWLVYENMALSDVIHGASSEILWEQLGDLSTRILALGAHRGFREPACIPAFLVQMRKRLFAASYRIDKSIATFLGRPPRLSSRYYDCGFPLCIDDHIFGASSDVFDREVENLDANGWSICAKFEPAAWIRLRFSNALFREEILDMFMRPSDPQAAQQLNDILRRCKENWQSHPSYLHYTPEVWDGRYNITTIFMLTLSYLAHLYNEFLIRRFLVRQYSAPDASLQAVSSQILSTVLLLIQRHGRKGNFYVDLGSIIPLYGFPAACVLANALKLEYIQGVPATFPIARAQIIRDLCVFSSHLESLEVSSNGSDAHFKRASEVLRGVIDEAITWGLNLNNSSLSTSDADHLHDATMDISGDAIDLENMDFGMIFDEWFL